MEATAFLKKIDQIPDLPTLPSVALNVNSLLEDYNTTISHLTEAIEKDQVIVSKILRLVNSPFYGFSSKIDNISRAVVILGFDTVRNAVLAVSVIGAFSGEEAVEGFDLTDYWRHCVSVAVTSRRLAGQTRIEAPERCFVAGLLHDIGKLILFQFFSDLFSRILSLACEQGISFYEAEKEVVPSSHARIGGYLAGKWHLPLSLIDAISFHHEPGRDSASPNLNFIVHAADIIVNAFTPGSGKGLIADVHPEVRKVMAKQLETVDVWFPEISAEIDSACKFFLGEA